MQMPDMLWCSVPLSLLAITVTGCSPHRSQHRPVPNELPRSWSLEDISKATPLSTAGGRVYVLAWKVVQDERPVRVERCLVMRVLDLNDGDGRWILAHLARRPDEDNPEWRVATSHISGKPGTKYFPGLTVRHYKRFKDQTGNKDVYASLSKEEVAWSFGQDTDCKFVGCAVCENSWQAALGESPTLFFGN
jgi:hypothetical protein